jgi:Holliday junction resolvase RusA-like endonuclease|tara:strand:+ start:2931 stop:3368 length:438 start_codon:yes stop_codon:yes gene_type:complete
VRAIEFEVRGNPHAQKRHRHTKTGHTYDPSAEAKKELLMQVQRHAPLTPINTPVALDCIFYFPPPKSTPKYKIENIRDGLVPYAKKRGDIDNLAKFVLDALNGVYWTDDAIVYSLSARKYYSIIPRTEIKVYYDFKNGNENDSGS